METLTFEKPRRIRYNYPVLARQNLDQEVNTMCNFDFSTFYQILCRLFSIGC